MPKNSTITALNTVGQSIWYDNLSRDVLRSGELASLIANGVSGLTSNPTIFKKAIADTSDYDTEIGKLLKQGADANGICEELMVQDVGAAADLLRPVFVESKGADGYASIEVSPFLANDTAQTIEAAQRIWKKLSRPNVMIKIPATPAGLPAIEQVLASGINVNITLIFSPDVHGEVMEAYLKALEKRAAAKQSVKEIRSVASFFVSRVDSICEKSFDGLVKAGKAKAEDRAAIVGTVGIANSKVAYDRYESIFKSDRFKKLEGAGALVQRPLWASTGTKNPEFPPLLYVEQLAGRDTVNTLPPDTLKILLKGAEIEPRLHQGLDQAKEVIKRAVSLGLPVPQLLLDLRDQGVKLFADSYQELLDAVEKKSKALSS